jgi:hypothetical protein
MSIVAVSVGTSATLIKAKNYKRIELQIDNDSGNTVYIGDADSVTTSTGIRVLNGAKFTLSYNGGAHQFFYRGPIYGIASGTSAVRVLELEETRT